MAPKLLQRAGQLLNLLLPPACPLCARSFPHGWSEPFCCRCLEGFSPLPAAHCPCCALPFIAADSSAHLCAQCCRSAPPYAKVYAAGLYQKTLRRAIQQFKFNQLIGLDRPLASLLDRALAEPLSSQLIVPVPMHKQRLKQRSYNQALLLARELGRIRKLPVSHQLLLRQLPSVPQQGLSARERERNLRGAFNVTAGLDGTRVLLVDDVMTTGTTVRESAQALLAAGAGEVKVAVVARAPAETNGDFRDLG